MRDVLLSLNVLACKCSHPLRRVAILKCPASGASRPSGQTWFGLGGHKESAAGVRTVRCGVASSVPASPLRLDDLNRQALLIVCKISIRTQNRQAVIDRHGANQKIGVGALYALCPTGVE